MPLRTQPVVIGHRGAPMIAPENTMQSFRKAWKLGADMVELDVHMTKDRHLVVIHDYDLSRIASIENIVAEINYSDLKSIDVGNGECVPLLRDVLQWANGKLLVNVEIKVPNVEQDVLIVVDELKMMGSVMFSSFLQQTIRQIKEIEPNAWTALLLTDVEESSIEIAKNLHASAINPLFYNMPDYFVQIAHDAGLEVYPWTVNDEDIMLDLILKGVDGLITDLPDLARKTVQEQFGRK